MKNSARENQVSSCIFQIFERSRSTTVSKDRLCNSPRYKVTS